MVHSIVEQGKQWQGSSSRAVVAWQAVAWQTVAGQAAPGQAALGQAAPGLAEPGLIRFYCPHIAILRWGETTIVQGGEETTPCDKC